MIKIKLPIEFMPFSIEISDDFKDLTERLKLCKLWVICRKLILGVKDEINGLRDFGGRMKLHLVGCDSERLWSFEGEELCFRVREWAISRSKLINQCLG